METLLLFKLSVSTYQSTRCNIPQYLNFQRPHGESLKSRSKLFFYCLLSNTQTIQIRSICCSFWRSLPSFMLYFSNDSPSDPDATLPMYSSTDRLQMAGDVARLNVGVPWTATSRQETPMYRIQSHGFRRRSVTVIT